MNVQIDGPNGKELSNVWVIKKQDRVKRVGQEDQVTVLAFYYIVGDAIYQAPSVAKIMTNRLVCLHSIHIHQALTSQALHHHVSD
jgi:mediator of RNA polymerase II transcription subunit 6